MLTNPRKRLAAEVGWFPGEEFERVSDGLSRLATEPATVRDSIQAHALSRANLLAEGLVAAASKLEAENIVAWILDLAQTHERIDPAETARLVNEERTRGGYPAITDLADIESELRERGRYFRQRITRALDELPTRSLVKVVTVVVEVATDDGDCAAPALVDDLVEAFEVQAQEFLEAEGANITKVLEQIRDAGGSADARQRLPRLVSDLEGVAKNWDSVAQPLQVSARSRGLRHDASHEIAHAIRRVAVEISNRRGLVEFSRRMNDLLREVFAEVDQLAEQAKTDAEAIENLMGNEHARAEQPSFEAFVGKGRKERLGISPDMIEWQGRRIPIEEVTALRTWVTQKLFGGLESGVGGRKAYRQDRDPAPRQGGARRSPESIVDELWFSDSQPTWGRAQKRRAISLRTRGGRRLRDPGSQRRAPSQKGIAALQMERSPGNTDSRRPANRDGWRTVQRGPARS